VIAIPRYRADFPNVFPYRLRARRCAAFGRYSRNRARQPMYDRLQNPNAAEWVSTSLSYRFAGSVGCAAWAACNKIWCSAESIGKPVAADLVPRFLWTVGSDFGRVAASPIGRVAGGKRCRKSVRPTWLTCTLAGTRLQARNLHSQPGHSTRDHALHRVAETGCDLTPK
jgi:hypothetical protein